MPGVTSIPDSFCIYCQKDYKSLDDLKKHLKKVHPGSWADQSYNGTHTDEV